MENYTSDDHFFHPYKAKLKKYCFYVKNRFIKMPVYFFLSMSIFNKLCIFLESNTNISFDIYLAFQL